MLQGKRILVTGAASGIGAAVVGAVTQGGGEVVALDRAAGPGITALDVADDRSVEAMVDELAREGSIDGLVNCAGISGIGALDEIGMDIWDEVMNVNLRGTALMCRAVLPHMRRQRSGSIVNIGSTFGLLAREASVAYGVSKAAVIHLTRSMAVDLADSGVRVNCVCPGLIETPMTAPLFEAGAEDAHAGNLRLHALRRAARPAEVAAAVAFLLADTASFVTGAAIPVDGGYTAGKWV